MLDTATKRRIDTARDILVGKVPDPKSQVEQITIALIYKFMDDMDAESEELGGKRKFFTGDYARYGWAKLMAPSLGGHEMLGLYGEGIAKMPENPGIPPLFRDIFKNAYLPYRDPETLKAFLKIIDEFSYDHSERLGDAFEYLLSVLGSQGDAGQFRTPRHIIDFMVEILAPRKDETILDPACGTAGFLISAYKHILRSNTDAKGNSTLTPDDKGRIAKNFKGYDISPDMVRLSLVNLYLHGFTDPHIVEYDSLTSEERWNEFADVILANPPFMSPKGGIKPHKRFSIQAKRSEVLFVDYMAEHLTPTGRAAIIVPEGIIFQSQTAYKDLRKMLVENALVAVVSLPAGCFNPYSGVKTSILILDKSLAKVADTIAFFKVANDGFGLGAQRRAIDKNDLPQVQAELAAYLQALRAKASTDTLAIATGLIVKKEKIAANGDYNLSGERYREGVASNHSFPLVFLGEESLFRVESGGTPKSDVEEYWGGGIPWATLVDLPATDFISEITATKRTISDKGLRESSAKMIPANSVVVSTRATIGRIAINRVPIATNQGFKNVVIEDAARAVPEFVALALTKLVPTMQAWATGGTFAEISKSKFCELQIPLPPLEVQKEIVAEIEGYQKVIDGARAVLDNYRPHIPIHPDWPIFELSEVTTKITDGAHFTPTYVETGVPFLRVTDITESNTSKKFIPKEEHDELIKRCRPEKGDVLYSKNGTIGIAKLVDWDWEFSIFVSLCLIKPKRELLDPHYLKCFLNSDTAYAQATARSKSGTVTNLHLIDIKTIKIPLPPLATQQAIVAEIEAEQALVNANRELIARFEKKIQATLARVWGENAAEPFGENA
ncbi:N-6 DNA methylase [Rhodoferax sp.]|uniref:N-6 DNA methylase n=5 Tax=Rhodoferax sp. TaxID=50421 RepID=UPI003BB577F0